MENKKFLNVEDVASYMGVSMSMAYRIIRNLNKELATQGYITVAGRVSRAFFEEKVYGLSNG